MGHAGVVGGEQEIPVGAHCTVCGRSVLAGDTRCLAGDADAIVGSDVEGGHFPEGALDNTTAIAEKVWRGTGYTLGKRATLQARGHTLLACL